MFALCPIIILYSRGSYRAKSNSGFSLPKLSKMVDLVKINKMITAVGTGPAGINAFVELDSHERSFSDDWLPSWKLLQTSLIAEYKAKLRSGEESVKNSKDKGRLPVAMALGKIVCYACGGAHKRGDPACKAGPNDVHPDAPQHFKLRQAAKKRKFEEGGGKQKGKDVVQFKKAKPDG